MGLIVELGLSFLPEPPVPVPWDSRLRHEALDHAVDTMPS